jgi:quinol monooxygenase YgiN
MNKYGLHNKLQAQEGKGPDLAAMLLEASRLVSTAPGCHIYIISLDEGTPDAVWVTEVWDSKEDHDNSLKDPAVRTLIGQAMPLFAGMPEGGQTLKVLGGTILPFA